MLIFFVTQRELITLLIKLFVIFLWSVSLFSSQNDLDFVQCMSAGYSVQKDPEKATTCRERGNASFQTRDYIAAALHYSQVM